MKKIYAIIVAITAISSAKAVISSEATSQYSKSQINRKPINWAPLVSDKTIDASLYHWRRYRDRNKLSIDDDKFMDAVKQGTYEFISYKNFKQNFERELLVFSIRLRRSLTAKTAEEVYPPDDRPKGYKDIESIGYHLKTEDLVSPICIARVKFPNGVTKMVRLDGNHRIAAAMMRQSGVKVFFIDL